ncbi:lytic transglycosylase [Sphingopyxis witflariensis]|uniref:Lytic transglycosylase n=2 Tax=Sphingopyxis witflariensis TaxID=173675 RepID=A0A246J8V7_9SPHN|nr:lytic transglycosylase [Sphingopyxis witflariensis]
MRFPIIPLFAGKPSHPFVPLGRRPAGARSEGQGRPKAGAPRAPLTAASTLAGWRRSGIGSALMLAVVLLSGGGAPAPVMAQDMPAARSAAVHPSAAHVADASRRFGIPEAWIWAVMRVESGGNARAVSRAGAMGLMQIMPATWAGLRTRYGLGPDPFDVRDNIMAGAAYLREMHDRYGNASAMLAAYNAGPGRYDDFVSRGRPLPAETVGYLAQLAPITGGSGAVEVAVSVPPDPFAWRRAALFVRTGSDASDAVAVQSGSGETAPETLSGSVESDGGRTTDPSPNVARDTLFVSRARAGRPQ